MLERDIPKEEMLGEIILNKGKNLERAYKIIESNIKQDENMYLVNLYLRDKYEEKSEFIIKEIYDFMEELQY